VEEFEKDFCAYIPYRDTELLCWKGVKEKNIDLIPTARTVREWLEETLTTYGNARELEGVEKVEREVIAEVTWYRNDEGVNEIEQGVNYVKVADVYGNIAKVKSEFK
jgi:hypothetical protein